MIRLVFILAAVLGVFVCLAAFLPASRGMISHHVPWFSWAMGAGVITAYIGFKITK